MWLRLVYSPVVGCGAPTHGAMMQTMAALPCYREWVVEPGGACIHDIGECNDVNGWCPVCTARRDASKEWFIGALPVPIPVSMVGEYLELIRHWEQNIRNHYERDHAMPEGG